MELRRETHAVAVRVGRYGKEQCSALHGSLWQCLEWLKINGKGNIISITDAANPAIYLWLSYSLWELTV